MAKKVSSRVAAKLARDKWKAKRWYKIITPPSFNSANIGETLSDDEGKLLDRVAPATLYDITGDFSKSHVKTFFRIYRTSGSEAYTYFIGHELSPDYIRRLTRRKTSKMDAIFTVQTKDNFKMVVKPVAITDNRIQSSQQRSIRKIMESVIKDYASKRTYADFAQDMVQGKIGPIVNREAKSVYPIKRVEVRKSELLSVPPDFDFSAFQGTTSPEEPEEKKEGQTPSPAPIKTASSRTPKKKKDETKPFIDDLCRLKGIGPSKAKLLFEHGFRTVGDIQKSTVDKLAQVSSISRSLAERLLTDAQSLEADKDLEEKKGMFEEKEKVESDGGSSEGEVKESGSDEIVSEEEEKSDTEGAEDQKTDEEKTEKE